MRRPRAANVVEFYVAIERLNFTTRTMSNKPTEKVLLSDYLVLIDVIEQMCRASLPLLSKFPFDEGDAKLRARIAKWDADPPHPRAAM